MEIREIFMVLEIPETKDEEKIREAYRRLLVEANPEDEPEKFKRLRMAYEEALAFAKRTDKSGGIQTAQWLEHSAEFLAFFQNLEKLYESLERRISEAEWMELLSDSVLDSLDEGEQAEWGLFAWLANHYWLPCKIWRVLEKRFFITENQEEFKEHLPEYFVSYILSKIGEGAELSDFRFEKLKGEPQADYDGFLRQFFSFCRQFAGHGMDMQSVSQEELIHMKQGLEKLDSFGISHPRLSFEWIRWHIYSGDKEEFLTKLRALMAENGEDEDIYLRGAYILRRCGETEEARSIYELYLGRERQTMRGRFTSFYHLAHITVEQEEWEQARFFAVHAWKACSYNDELYELLGKIRLELIKQLTSGNCALSRSQSEILRECFVYENRVEEGKAFFDGHPEYAGAESEEGRQALALMDSMWAVLQLRESHSYESMAAECEKMLEIDPRFFWACYYLQEAYKGLGEAQMAVDTFYRAKEIYGRVPEIYLLAYEVFYNYNQNRDAYNILQQAEECGAMNHVLMVKKITVLNEMIEDKESWQRADEYAAEAIARLESEKADRSVLAEAYLQRAYIHDRSRDGNKDRKIHMDKEYAEHSLGYYDTSNARFFLGRYYERFEGNFELAYHHLKICQERGVEFDWLYFYIARCHEGFGQWDQAIVYYKKAVEQNPDNPECCWRIAWLYRMKYRRTAQPEYAKEAFAYIELQEQRFGSTAMLWRQRMDLYLVTGEYENALDAVEHALELDDDSGLRLARGRALKGLGRYDEAVKSFELSLISEDRYGEDNSDVCGHILECFLKMGTVREGIEWFEKKLEEDPPKELRSYCMASLRYLEASDGNYDRASFWIERQYGSAKLTRRRFCLRWIDEASRFWAIVQLHIQFQDFNRKEVLKLCKKGAVLARKAYHDRGKPAGERAEMCHNAGMAFYYLGDYRRAAALLESARILAEMAGDYSDKENLLKILARAYYRNSERDRARSTAEAFLQHQARIYEECSELKLPTEELMVRSDHGAKLAFYNLFWTSFCSGKFKRARAYAEGMEKFDDCTEYWEVVGMLAWLDEKWEEARGAFENANRFCGIGNNLEAVMMLRQMEKREKLI